MFYHEVFYERSLICSIAVSQARVFVARVGFEGTCSYQQGWWTFDEHRVVNDVLVAMILLHRCVICKYQYDQGISMVACSLYWSACDRCTRVLSTISTRSIYRRQDLLCVCLTVRTRKLLLVRLLSYADTIIHPRTVLRTSCRWRQHVQWRDGHMVASGPRFAVKMRKLPLPCHVSHLHSLTLPLWYLQAIISHIVQLSGMYVFQGLHVDSQIARFVDILIRRHPDS